MESRKSDINQESIATNQVMFSLQQTKHYLEFRLRGPLQAVENHLFDLYFLLVKNYETYREDLPKHHGHGDVIQHYFKINLAYTDKLASLFQYINTKIKQTPYTEDGILQYHFSKDIASLMRRSVNLPMPDSGDTFNLTSSTSVGRFFSAMNKRVSRDEDGENKKIPLNRKK